MTAPVIATIYCEPCGRWFTKGRWPRHLKMHRKRGKKVRIWAIFKTN